MVVDTRQDYRTRAGFSWGEIYTFFAELSKIRDENGIGYGAKAIVDSMATVEHAPIQLRPDHAITLLAAGCLAHYLELDKKAEKSERDQTIALCWRCALSMIGRIEMTQINLLTIATQIRDTLKHYLDIPPYSKAVLEQIARTIEAGGFDGTQKLRTDLIAYIHDMQTSQHDITKRQEAIEACCVILTYFH